jgi:glutathione S-transferase
MKLYYAPGACSMSPHIVALEAGLDIKLEAVDLKTKKTATGKDFWQINSKGSVPALELDDGSLLTEGPAIVQYLADKAPASKLAPANGTMERVRLQEWLNFVTSEMHKGIGGFFNPKFPEEWRSVMKEMLAKKFDWLSSQLNGKTYLMGEQFTVADAYLFTVLGWTAHVGIDLSKWPVLTAYQGKVASRPAVQKAMEAEGLKKAA